MKTSITIDQKFAKKMNKFLTAAYARISRVPLMRCFTDGLLTYNWENRETGALAAILGPLACSILSKHVSSVDVHVIKCLKIPSDLCGNQQPVLKLNHEEDFDMKVET